MGLIQNESSSAEHSKPRPTMWISAWSLSDCWSILFWKFHDDIFNRFPIILLTDKQTDANENIASRAAIADSR